MVTVIVTRPLLQQEPFTSRLKHEGFNVVSMPLVEISPYSEDRVGKEVVEALCAGTFDWVLFSSINGVRALSGILGTRKLPTGVKIGCQGRKTSEAAQSILKVSVSLQPEAYVSETFAEAFRSQDLKGKKVLLAVAKETRDVLPKALSAQGASVTKLAVYETLPVKLSGKDLEKNLGEGDAIITFFSPSAFKSFVNALSGNHRLLKRLKLASIGPVTTRAIEETGMIVSYEARDHTDEGLLKVLLAAK